MGLMQSPRGVVIFDTKLRIVWANEAAGRPGDGLPTAAWPGRRLGEVLPRLDADVIEQSLRRVVAPRKPQDDHHGGSHAHASPGGTVLHIHPLPIHTPARKDPT